MSSSSMGRRCVASVGSTLAAAAALLVVLLAGGAAAYGSYRSRIPNGHNVTVDGAVWPGVGHVARGGGGARNAFGVAFAAADHVWTRALCEADTDGDGFTNGEELGDCDCMWTEGATPQRTDDITHPAIAASYPTIPDICPHTPSPTTPPPPPTAAPPGEATIAAIPGALDFGSAPSDAAAREYLLTLRTPTPAIGSPPTWVAVCFCNETMTGPVVLCTISVGTGDGAVTAECFDYDAHQFGISRVLPAGARQSRLVNSSAVDGHVVVVARVNASTGHLPSAAERSDSFSTLRKANFAVGHLGTHLVPHKHANNATAMLIVDFATGTVVPPPSPPSGGGATAIPGQLNFTSAFLDVSVSARYVLSFEAPLPPAGAAGRWVAVCVCNETMTGPVVLCAVRHTSNGTVEVNCSDYLAHQYGISPVAPAEGRSSQLRSFGVAGGGASITVEATANAHTIGLPLPGPGVSAVHLANFAVGALDGGGRPHKHASDGTAQRVVDFASGRIVPPPVPPVPPPPPGPPPPSIVPGPGESVAIPSRLVFGAQANPQNPGQYLLTFRVPLPEPGTTAYAASCFCAQTMVGAVVMCTISVGTGDGAVTAECFDYDARQYSVARVAPTGARQTSVFRHSVSDGVVEVVAMINASTGGLPDGDRVDGDFEKRTNFAVGAVSQQGVPQQHAQGSTGLLRVNYATGATAQLPNPYFAINVVYIAGGASFALWIGVGLLLRAAGIHVPTRVVPLVQIFGLLWMLGLSVAMIVVAKQQLSHKSAATFRAFGHSTVLLLGFVLFPVTKNLPVAVMELAFGQSFERAVSFHAIIGVLILIYSTVHFGGMFNTYAAMDDGRRTMLRWDPKPSVEFQTGFVNIPLAGLVAWCCIAATSVVAMARVKLYSMFRVAHGILYLGVLIMIVFHVPASLFIMLPGIVVRLGDYLLTIRSHFAADAALQDATHHKGAKVTELSIRVRPAYMSSYEPGQYVFVGLNGTMVPHPFSIASYDRATSVIRLFVRNTENGNFTSKLAEAVAASPERFIVENANKVSVSGPHGRLMVPLHRCRHVVLVSGGIGITPMLSILEHLSAATAVSSSRSGAVQITHCTFVWSVREAAMLNLFAPVLEQLCGSTARINVHLTQRGGSAPAAAVAVHSGRPDLMRYVADAVAAAGSADAVGVFTCGPEPLMLAAAEAAVAAGTMFHNETFGFGGTPRGALMSLRLLAPAEESGSSGRLARAASRGDTRVGYSGCATTNAQPPAAVAADSAGAAAPVVVISSRNTSRRSIKDPVPADELGEPLMSRVPADPARPSRGNLLEGGVTESSSAADEL